MRVSGQAGPSRELDLAAQKDTQSDAAGQTTIIIPCRQIDLLTRRCVDRCIRACPGAAITVLPDEAPGDGQTPAGVTVLPSGPVNPSAKRNLGARAAATEYIALIDNDAYPAAGWLAAAVSVLRSEPDLGAVGGPNVSPPDQPLARRIVGNACRSFLVAGPCAYRKIAGAAARDCDHLSSCNLVMRREEYLAVGGMDETVFIGDDTFLSARLRDHGRRLRFATGVLVYHQDRSLRGFVAQRIARGVDLLRVTAATRRKELFLHFLPAALLVFLLAGWVLLFYPGLRWIYVAVPGAYAAACLIESIRHSARAAEWPGTLLAIVVGNLGPGVGILLRAIHMAPDLRRIYRNDT